MAGLILDEQIPFLARPDEPQSALLRQATMQLEPRCQRTYTPTGAVIARSSGCYHWTPEGRKLVDFTSGVLVANLGHHPARWWRRVLDYIGLETEKQVSGFYSGVPLIAYNAITQLEVEASRRLLANLAAQPGGSRFEQILWAASGSEGVQKAIKIALAQSTDADVILATRSGFHGKKGLAEAVTGSEQDPERDARVHFISFPINECSSVIRRREPIDLAPYRNELNELLARFGNRICCLITEPYLGGSGSYHPHPEYLQLLEKFCRDNGILFILDEVQANFGRTGSMYAFSTYGIEPDMVVLGKGMGNGVPVNAVAGPAHVFAKLEYGTGSDTWSGHPLGCAAVLATLDEFEQGEVLRHAEQLSKVIENGLLRLAELDAIKSVRGEGVVWGIHCAPTKSMTAEEVANTIVRDCYLGDEEGRAIHLLGPLAGCVIRIAPPLVLPLAEATECFQLMYKVSARL